MDDNSSTYTIRIPNDLKKAFEIAAKAEDITGAQLLRRWIRGYTADYMKNHAQQELLTPAKPQAKKGHE